MKYKSSFLNEAYMRGFFYQSTNLDAMDDYLCTPGKLGYAGFDATAKSLHVGHLLPIFLLRLFQKHGHKPVALVGGGTTKIGDPSFRSTARPILTNDEIAENILGLKGCLSKFLSFDDNSNNCAMFVNNADWLDSLQYIAFLRDIGKYFSINRMITFDSVKSKLTENNTLSFLEFNYMIMQAYDFYELYTSIGCTIQFGGQDQWGNIICGVELIKKKIGKEVFGFTNPLLIKNDGQKMGKTADGAVWLSNDLMSSYDFWQYWRNVDDADVVKLMYLFTDVSVDEIKKMESIKGTELNDIKKILADEVTAIVHGRDVLEQIHNTVAGVFCNGNTQNLDNLSAVPKLHISLNDLENINIIDILVSSYLCDSRGEAKRLVKGGGVCVDNLKIDEQYSFIGNNIKEKFIKISVGKKKHLILILE